MGYRVTGTNFGPIGLQWEKTKSDKDVAHAVIRFMEDRRLLFGVRFFEDSRYCVESAIEARKFLTDQLTYPGLGKGMTASLQAIRTAMRRFVDVAGPDGTRFPRSDGHRPDPFAVALGELRGVVGMHLAAIAFHHDIEVEYELASIFPRDDDDDTSWIPGFTG